MECIQVENSRCGLLMEQKISCGWLGWNEVFGQLSHAYRKPYVLLIPPPWKVSPPSNPSRWMVSPPKHVLRGWPTCYDGGTDTSAERTPLGWRYTCLLGGRTTTAVLNTYICWANTSWLTIHLHLPLGRTYMLRRRYISWADNTHTACRSITKRDVRPGRKCTCSAA